MSELIVPQIALPEFKTKQEAEQATQAFVKKADLLRQDLLDLFLRNAHGKLGYDSFELYSDERLNINFNKQNLYQMREWAKVERVLAPCSSNAAALLDNGIQIVKLNRSTARELVKLPSAEQQKEAFEQSEGLKQHGARTPGEYLTNLKRIVARMLKGENEPVPPAPDIPSSSAFDKAVDAPAAPVKPDAPKGNGSKPSSSPVSSFTPSVDADPDLEFTPAVKKIFDYAHAIETLQTVQTWLENEETDGSRRDALLTCANLNEISCWVEEQSR